MAHAAVLRSPQAHARIVRIDTSRARALPGVYAVITGDDAKELSNPLPAFCAEPRARRSRPSPPSTATRPRTPSS